MNIQCLAPVDLSQWRLLLITGSPASHHNHAINPMNSFMPQRTRRSGLLITALAQRTEDENSGNAGDEKVQQILVDIVRLQAGKLRVSEFLDERSKHLTEIADQAKEEYDRIAEDTMKGIDEASSKVMRTVEEDAQAFEQELASARAEIETREQEFDEFEKKVEVARSEGLFFKGLYKPFKRLKDRAPEEQKAIKEQAKNIAEVTKKSLGSRSRRSVYTVLLFLLSLTVFEIITSTEISWPRLALYGAILVCLGLQLSYEKFISKQDDSNKL